MMRGLLSWWVLLLREAGAEFALGAGGGASLVFETSEDGCAYDGVVPVAAVTTVDATFEDEGLGYDLAWFAFIERVNESPTCGLAVGDARYAVALSVLADAGFDGAPAAAVVDGGGEAAHAAVLNYSAATGAAVVSASPSAERSRVARASRAFAAVPAGPRAVGWEDVLAAVEPFVAGRTAGWIYDAQGPGVDDLEAVLAAGNRSAFAPAGGRRVAVDAAAAAYEAAARGLVADGGADVVLVVSERAATCAGVAEALEALDSAAELVLGGCLDDVEEAYYGGAVPYPLHLLDQLASTEVEATRRGETRPGDAAPTGASAARRRPVQESSETATIGAPAPRKRGGEAVRRCRAAGRSSSPALRPRPAAGRPRRALVGVAAAAEAPSARLAAAEASGSSRRPPPERRSSPAP